MTCQYSGVSMSLNVNHLLRTVDTLEQTLMTLEQCRGSDSLPLDLYQDMAIERFELSLETTGKLLRKALKAFTARPREVDELVFFDVLRHAGKHGLLDSDGVERWIGYRKICSDRTNSDGSELDEYKRSAHEVLALLPQYVLDARALAPRIQAVFDAAA